MTDLVLSPITTGYNLSLINQNFTDIVSRGNTYYLQTKEGHNVMSQDLDMNSYDLLNVKTNFSLNGSMLTVGDAKSHFYQVGLVPTAYNDADAINYSQVRKLIEAVGAMTNNVKALGAIGDGVTDDTDAIKAAVAAMVTSGADLYWPAGTYLTTDSIPNLHSVRHTGSGAIKRGSDMFYVNPKSSQVNRLYVSPTGSDANDGLSATQPTLTINAAMNRLPNYGPTLNGDWRVILAAGTYAPFTFPTGLGNKGYIRLWGPTVGHPNVPTAFIDAAGATNGACAIVTGPARIDMRDVKLQNATGTLSIGLSATMFCEVYLNNVHTDNIYTGIQVTQNSRLRQTGGIHTPGANGAIGIAAGVASSFSIGYQAGGFGLGPQITGAFYQGVKITEDSTGHVDYCVIDGAQIGIEVTQNCRVNDVGNDIKNCTVSAIRATASSCYANAGDVFTANATNFTHDAYGVHLPIATGAKGILRVGASTSTITHTGTVAKTILSTPFTIPAGYFTDPSKQLRVRITGKFTSAGVILLGVDLSGSVLTGVSSGGATSGTQFEAEMNIFATTSASQKYYEKLTQGTAVVRNDAATRTIDMTTSKDVQIVGTLAATGDTLVIETIEVYLVG